MSERNNQSQFHQQLKDLMDEYVHKVYDVSIHFPKDEMFGVTSQIRRASLSIILNYLEGYARRNNNVFRNFLEISYGSLKESKYLLYFSYQRKYMTKNSFQELDRIVDRIGKMIWGILEKI